MKAPRWVYFGSGDYCAQIDANRIECIRRERRETNTDRLAIYMRSGKMHTLPFTDAKAFCKAAGIVAEWIK